MDQIVPSSATLPSFTPAAIEQYGRDGYMVARVIMGSRSVATCHAAPGDLCMERQPARHTVLMYEGGPGSEMLPPEQREFAIRKYKKFVRDAQAVEMATLNRRLHARADRELGDNRVLFREITLRRSLHIGPEGPWHRDAAYFCLADPGLIIGVWIALDPRCAKTGARNWRLAGSRR